MPCREFARLAALGQRHRTQSTPDGLDRRLGQGLADDAAHVVAIALKRLQAAGAPSFLTVLKRFGAANQAPLSFPQPGWTLAADVPAGIDGLTEALDELDQLVANEGGRLYLAKDSRMHPEMMRKTYPELKAWQATRNSLDPRGVFTSDLARRLEL